MNQKAQSLVFEGKTAGDHPIISFEHWEQSSIHSGDHKSRLTQGNAVSQITSIQKKQLGQKMFNDPNTIVNISFIDRWSPQIELSPLIQANAACSMHKLLQYFVSWKI